MFETSYSQCSIILGFWDITLDRIFQLTLVMSLFVLQCSCIYTWC